MAMNDYLYGRSDTTVQQVTQGQANQPAATITALDAVGQAPEDALQLGSPPPPMHLPFTPKFSLFASSGNTTPEPVSNSARIKASSKKKSKATTKLGRKDSESPATAVAQHKITKKHTLKKSARPTVATTTRDFKKLDIPLLKKRALAIANSYESGPGRPDHLFRTANNEIFAPASFVTGILMIVSTNYFIPMEKMRWAHCITCISTHDGIEFLTLDLKRQVWLGTPLEEFLRKNGVKVGLLEIEMQREARRRRQKPVIWRGTDLKTREVLNVDEDTKQRVRSFTERSAILAANN